MTTFGVLGGPNAFATAKLHQMIIEHALQCGAVQANEFPALLIQSSAPTAVDPYGDLPELILKTADRFRGHVDKVVASFNTSYVNEDFMKNAFGRDRFVFIVDLVAQALPENVKVLVLDTPVAETQKLFEYGNNGKNTFFYPYPEVTHDLITAGRKNQVNHPYTQKQIVELMVTANQQECDVILLGSTDLSVFAPVFIEAGVAHVDALKLISNYIITEHYQIA